MKKRTAFSGAILSLIPFGQPFLIKTGLVLSTTGLMTFALDNANASERRVVTLYSSSSVIENYRAHIATFDADQPFGYNWGNCKIAADMWNQSIRENDPRTPISGIRVDYWCEKGRFRE